MPGVAWFWLAVALYALAGFIATPMPSFSPYGAK